MDPLTLNYWLSKFVQEVAKGSKDSYPLEMLYQIVCGICRFMVKTNPAIELNSLDSSDKTCVNWRYWRGGTVVISKVKEITSVISYLKTNIGCRIEGWDSSWRCFESKKRKTEKELVTGEEESQLWQSGVFGMETAKSLLNVLYY